MGRKRPPKKGKTQKGQLPLGAAVATVILALAAAAAMGPGLTGELLNWDDDRFVQNNELIRGVSADSLQQIFGEPHFEAYHPLHLLSYVVDHGLYGLWAPGYKLHNFALYCICLALLFLLLRRLGLGPFAAWAGTLLFAVHPLHVEAVVWVTARKETLSLALMLGAALTHLRSKRATDKNGIATLVLFVLAMLTKTSTVVLPPLLFAVDVLVRQKPWRKSLVRVVPLVAVSLVVGLYVISLWQENEMARPMPEQGTLGLVALAGKSYWHYLAKTLWPAALSPVYPIDRVGAFDVRALGGLILWPALLAAAFRSRDRLLSLAALWGAVALLPVSNLLPVYFFVQDRYAFIATVGLAVAVGRFHELATSRGWRWPAHVVVGVVAVALVFISGAQARHWRTSLALWQQATAVQPGSYYAFLALGHTQRDAGELDGAVEAYRQAIELQPELPYARISLCLSDARRNAQRRGRPESEVDQLGSALRQRWRSPPELMELATRLMVHGYAGCAQLAESRAFDLQSPAPADLVRAASRWVMFDQPQLAMRYLQRARTDEAEPDASALEVEAQALELLGQHDEARARLRRSLQLQPRAAERLLSAARQLLERNKPRLALLYADVAPTGELASEWAEVRRQAGDGEARRAAPDAGTAENEAEDND